LKIAKAMLGEGEKKSLFFGFAFIPRGNQGKGLKGFIFVTVFWA